MTDNLYIKMYEYERIRNVDAQITYPVHYDTNTITNQLALLAHTIQKIGVDGYNDIYRQYANLKYAVFYNQLEYP